MAIRTILMTFGKFYEHLVHFVLIWYIFPVLASRTNKNLATLCLVIPLQEKAASCFRLKNQSVEPSRFFVTARRSLTYVSNTQLRHVWLVHCFLH
jgi:hypothetical protein